MQSSMQEQAAVACMRRYKFHPHPSRRWELSASSRRSQVWTVIFVLFWYLASFSDEQVEIHRLSPLMILMQESRPIYCLGHQRRFSRHHPRLWSHTLVPALHWVVLVRLPWRSEPPHQKFWSVWKSSERIPAHDFSGQPCLFTDTDPLESPQKS